MNDSKFYKAIPLSISILALAITLISFKIFGNGWSDNWSDDAQGKFFSFLLYSLVAAIFFKIFFNKQAKVLISIFMASVLGLVIGIDLLVIEMLVFFALACLGVIFYSVILKQDSVDLSSALLVGLALHVGIINLMISHAVNYPLVYQMMLLLPILVVVVFFKAALVGFYKGVSSSVKAFENVVYWKFFVFIFFLAFVALFSIFPTIMYDDNVTHLSLWTQLSVNHIYVPNLKNQIWGVAPFATDILHAFSSVVVNADAKSPMTALLFLMTVFALLKLLAELDVEENSRIVAATLFISTPMIANLLIGLQSDLYLGFLAIISTLVAVKLFKEKTLEPSVALVAAAAIMMNTKLPGLLFLIGFFGLFVYLALSEKQYLAMTIQSKSHILILVILFGFIGAYPYINAFLKTGNPLFPMYNGIFKSELFPPTNFMDNRFSLGVNLTSYAGMFYDTSKHFESKNYVAGFQYFALLPLAFLYLLFNFKKIYVPLFTIFIIYAVPTFVTLQYVRYFYEIFPVATIIIALLLIQAKYKAFTHAIFYCFAFLNLLFFCGISWNFGLSPFTLVDASVRSNYVEQSAPEQPLNQKINQLKSNAVVLFDIGRPFGATLAGSAIYNAWYSPTYSNLISVWKDESNIKDFVQNERVDFIYWNQAVPYELKNTTRNLLGQYLNQFGVPKFQSGPIVAFSVGDVSQHYESEFEQNQFPDLQGYTQVGEPKVEQGDLVVTNTNLVTKQIQTHSANGFSYTINLKCNKDAGEFVAQINWDLGQPYYKIVQCGLNETNFNEVGLVPVGAKTGVVYLSARDGTQAYVSALKIGFK